MSLDVTLTAVRPTEVFTANITHNLNRMAKEAGIYEALWRPEEINVSTADELIPYLIDGLKNLQEDPNHYRQFDAPNGWGTYDTLVRFVSEYLNACIQNKDATIGVCR